MPLLDLYTETRTKNNLEIISTVMTHAARQGV